jgi:hypothetical protein
MNRVGSLVFIASMAGSCFGQVQKPCFAFLLKGDVSVSCDGQRTQVTRRGDIDQLAVSDDLLSLGFVTSRITKRTAISADAAYTTTLIDLKSEKVKTRVGPNSVISTCGGIFWGIDETRQHSDTRNLVTGDQIATPPYNWFRCSADRRVVVGIAKDSGGALYEGVPPQIKIAPGGTRFGYTFNLSADGSKVVYATDSSPLCVFSSSGPTQCAAEEAMDTFRDVLSVNNTGEVLVATHTEQGCFYKSPSNFSPTRTPGAGQDACLGIGYWKPGLKTIEIIEPLGRNPQWISPTTAKLMREWAAHEARDGK